MPSKFSRWVPKNPGRRVLKKLSQMSKQVHEVRGQSVIRVSNQNKIPKVQEANSRKIPTVQESIKWSQAERDPLEGRREVAIHHPSICTKTNRQAVVPKSFNLNLPHPSLWVHGACARGMSSYGGPQYDDGLEYEFCCLSEASRNTASSYTYTEAYLSR